ncbi:SymE family type I addiction module toxin [Pectobacterium araliae]|uniref:SymE family type I addiction module toxin n=1 Tax=Pectobacterium araliae TaxID=3073862 RepID=UPI003CE5463B
MHLTGKWLEDLDFNTGQPVIVTVEHGRQVIETELRFCPVKMTIPAQGRDLSSV